MRIATSVRYRTCNVVCAATHGAPPICSIQFAAMYETLLRWTNTVAGSAGLVLLSACASLLPSSHTDSSTFADFNAARDAVEGLLPNGAAGAAPEVTTFDPLHHPNATLLTQADVVRMFFIPNTLLTRGDLDPGVLACVEARGACHGIELKMAKIDKARSGNFLQDLFNIQRRTETTGWRFYAVILFVGDKIVYRAWGGQPSVNELEISHNPLGPLQELIPSAGIKP